MSMNTAGLSSGMQSAWGLGLAGGTPSTIADELADQHETFNISQTITVPALGLISIDGGGPVTGEAEGTAS